MIILHCFDVFGFNSGISYLSTNPHTIYCIYIVHVSIVTFATLFMFWMTVQYYSVMGFALATNEFGQYLICICSYWFVISESLFHRQSHRKFWLLLDHIDCHFSGQSKTQFRGYALKFIQFFLTTLLMFAIRMIWKIIDSKIDIMYNILFKICQIRLFYYIFCLEIVDIQLKMIEIETYNVVNLLKMKESQLLSIDKSIGLFALRRLKWIREYFYCIHEMIINLNEMFGWSHVTTTLSCFFLLLSEINWTYAHFHALPFAYRTGKLM